MSVSNNMDLLYSQNIGSNSIYTATNTKKVDAVTKVTAEQNSAPEVSAQKTDKDQAGFSKDTQVTSKMSDEDRAKLVDSLKADLEQQSTRFMNMMTQMFQKQGITSITAENDSFWKFIASGNYKVDAQTRAEAKEAISEDGYWGVKQTSQRIFDFAQAVAGDDEEKMKEMQAAVEKGFSQAKSAWGGEMPSITDDTYEAVNSLFEEYYASAAMA